MTAPEYKLRTAHKQDNSLGFISKISTHDGWAFASGGTYGRTTMLASEDGGPFVKKATPDTSGLRHCLARENDLLVAGEFGMIARSVDQGSSWTVCGNKGARKGGCLYGIAEAFGALLVTGDGGMVHRSDDDGETWQEVRSGGGRLLGLHVRDGGREVLLYGDQLVRFDGRSFETLENPGRAPLCAMAELDGVLVLVGDSGQLFFSEDGTDWTSPRLEISADLESVDTVADGILAVGSGGTVLFSEDGRGWTQVDVGSNEHFWSLAPVGDGALVGGAHGAIHHLHVNYESWSPAASDWGDEEFD